MKPKNGMKKIGGVLVGTSVALIVPASAAASDITTAAAGLAADVVAGLVAGIAVGVAFFGGKLVWRAIKGVSS